MGQKDTLRSLQRHIDASKWKVTVCPRQGHANMASELLGIAGSSALGTLIDQTGGLVVADGFIKHLGGDNATGDSLRQANGLDGSSKLDVPSSLGALVVAVDAFGGIFALPSQAIDPMQATVRYLPYDSMVWEDFRIGHGSFVAWSMGDPARGLYPQQGGCDMAYGQVIRCEPPLWMPRPGTKPVPSVAGICDVVRERVGMSCAIYDATHPEVMPA